jgi:nucleoid-associated protein YgaU
MPSHAEKLLRRSALLFCLMMASSAVIAQEFQNVTVKPGQTLWDIAQRYLDDPARWDEIVRHNSKLSQDPTVALPGMILRVPVKLLKAAMRAAVLSYVEGDILYKAREKDNWVKARKGQELFPGDTLKTKDWSRARIKFPHGSVLNLDSHSEAIIQPEKDGPDLKLVKGTLKAKHLKLNAGDVAVAPQTEETVYEVTAMEGSPVKVQVFNGSTTVAANGATTTVGSGSETEIPEGGNPALPRPLPEPLASLAKRTELRTEAATTTDLGTFNLDIDSIEAGTALAGFRVQLAKSPDFSEIVAARTFDPEEKINLGDSVASGVYYWRAAPVDLLGKTGKYSEPKRVVLR